MSGTSLPYIAADSPSFTNFVAKVQPFGDSITYGVGAATLAGWREPTYNTAHGQFPGQLYFVGSQSFAGGGNGLAVDPFMDGISGITAVALNTVLFRIATYLPDVVIYSAGTNDIAAGMAVDGVTTGFSGNNFVATGDYFTARSVGSAITVVGANNGNNNGTFTITAFIDTKHVTCSGSHTTEVFPNTASATLNSSASTVANTIGDGLDAIWALRTSSHFQIVLLPILKRLDGFDANAQAINALLPAMVAGKSYAGSITHIPGYYSCIPNPTVGVNMNDQIHPNDTGYPIIAAYNWNNGLRAAVTAARG